MEMEQPLVSVIIATYNRAEKVTQRAIPSALGQTWKNLELIVVGDCCTDHTDEAMSAIDDERLFWVNLPKRGNYPEVPELRRLTAGSVPANIGLHMATGEWLTHLDDDDEYTPTHIEDLFTYATANGYPFVYGKVLMEKGIEGNWSEQGGWPLKFGNIASMAGFYRKELKVVEFDENCWQRGIAADWDRWNRMQETGCGVGFLNEVVGKHYLEGAYKGYSICT